MKKYFLLHTFVIGSFVAQSAANETDNRDLRIKPSINHNTEFRVTYEDNGGFPAEKSIFVHRADISRLDETRSIYFHTPLFALMENPSPENGCPAIFWSHCDFGDDFETKRIKFRVSTRSPMSVEKTLTAILKEKSEKNWLSENNFSDEDVKIFQWPISRIKSDIIDENTGEIVARGENLGTAYEQADFIDIYYDVTSVELKQILNGIDQQSILIIYKYKYDNVVRDTATQRISITTAIKDEINSYVDQNNLDKANIIFNEQRQEHISNISNVLKSSITATDAKVAELLPDIGQDYVKGLFPERRIDITASSSISKNDPQLANSIYSHLEAIVEEYSRKNRTIDQTRDTQTSSSGSEDVLDNTTTVKLEYKKPTGPTGSLTEKDQNVKTITKEQKEELENLHRVELETDSTTGNVKPTAITVSKLSSNWERLIVTRVDRATLSSQGTETYSAASPLPVTFLESSVDFRLPTNVSLAPYVPIGTALCTFRKSLPEGYVWADGKSEVPDNSVFPEHLNTIPNMNDENVLVGGAGVETDIGALSLPGKLPIPPEKIDNQALTFRASTNNAGGVNTYHLDLTHASSGGSEGERSGSSCRGGGTITVQPNHSFSISTPEKCSDRYSFRRQAFNVPSTQHLAPSSALAGDRTIFRNTILDIKKESAPPHIKCNWIVRIK